MSIALAEAKYKLYKNAQHTHVGHPSEAKNIVLKKDELSNQVMDN
jgi:hypothetical protein